MSELTFDVGLASKLKQAVLRNGIADLADIDWLCEGDNLVNVRRVRLGHAVITEREPPEPKPEVPLDTIIRVDRAVRPVYPDWMKNLMHPKLEATGPAEYDLATVQLWLHDGQQGGNWVKGQNIYDHLKSNNMLEGCLGLRDGEEIKKKGIEVFRKFFGGKAVFLWRSVVQHRDGDLSVPCLIEDGGEVVVLWLWLGRGWVGSSPAARFAS